MEPQTDDARSQGAGCCPHLHEAVELIGRRWTGAIIEVLRHDGPLRFSEIVQAIPGLSDRLCSERMKELEARGVVERTVHPGPPVRVEYSGVYEDGECPRYCLAIVRILDPSTLCFFLIYSMPVTPNISNSPPYPDSDNPRIQKMGLGVVNFLVIISS